RLWCVSVLLVLWASTQTLPLLAQNRAPIIDDPDRLFGDGSAVRSAALRLAGEGADVVVIAVRNAGRDTTAAQEYLNRRLNELGIATQYRSLRGKQIVFFLATQPGYHSIHYVSSYRPQLDPVYRGIATNDMQPLFTRDEWSEGMVAGIDAVKNTLNPPTPRAVPITLGVVGVLAVCAVIAMFVLRRRAVSNARSAARQRVDQARRAAGVAIADLGRRVHAAQEQARFDEVSYGQENAVRIATIQARGERLFAQAQAAFDAAEERTSGDELSPENHASVIAEYGEATRLVQEATGPIEEAEQRRLSLDRAASSR
ncbi:MAG: hypothetical protein AVDCRST_MAG93-8843, partial [uncultured Chloroflexia bacterium]